MITWRPMTEHPTAPSTAMIRATDAEGAILLPGPVMWDASRQCWVDEDTGEPASITREPETRYEWAFETDIVAEVAA